MRQTSFISKLFYFIFRFQGSYPLSCYTIIIFQSEINVNNYFTKKFEKAVILKYNYFIRKYYILK
nr:MAG TPA: hypothetical protein [Caudoviricetes sp.]